MMLERRERPALARAFDASEKRSAAAAEKRSGLRETSGKAELGVNASEKTVNHVLILR
jgi:hypothetical protein